jgi:hypothetical protein
LGAESRGFKSHRPDHSSDGFAIFLIWKRAKRKAVNLSRYREAFSPSRAKDDPLDAKLLAEILRLHRDKLSLWKPDDEQTRTLTFLNEERRKAVDLRTKLVLRLQAALKLYFPQAIEWVGVYSSPEGADKTF